MEQLSLLEDSRREDPSCDDRSHVIRIADRVLAELQAEPPIDLGMVASFQGIASVRQCALPNGGCLVTDADSGAVEIRLRSSDHPRRQRFTGFHEVTHTFLPGYRLQVQWRCDPSPAAPAKEEIEVLCDVGASELILPRRMVSDDLAGADFGLPVIFTIADAYHASVQATAHRFVDLWPEDILLIVAEVAHKPADARNPQAAPRVRVQYSSGSGRWPFIPRHKSFDDGDPVVRALAGELIDERTTLRGLSTETVEGVDLSARICPYFDSQGEKHDRVLALYRRPAHHR